MNPANQKLSLMGKIGHSPGGLAAKPVFQTLVAFLAFFILFCCDVAV
jgi:hypothetical protein